MQTQFEFELPDWVARFVAEYDKDFSTPEQRMAFVIALSAENIKHKTGGPFGAAIFDSKGQLIAPGVNLVTTSNSSILHAEMVAIALAQKALDRYNLSDSGKENFELAASTEPCAMCFGAVPWSGVKQLLCGARDEDARAVGFDEGAKLSEWPEALKERGITVARDIERQAAVNVLNEYAKQQGTIY
jgi:tRNA(Arg) A34 adenosine deaminase TadA